MAKATEAHTTKTRRDWATDAAINILQDVQQLNFTDALEIVAGRLRDAHHAGQLRSQQTVREGR
jgi:hypothetical protein